MSSSRSKVPGPNVLSMGELIIGPIDDQLTAGADPVLAVDSPGALAYWTTLSEADVVWWLAAGAWDSRTAPLPQAAHCPDGIAYATALHKAAAQHESRAECEALIHEIGLPDRRTSFAAALLLLAAHRAEVQRNHAWRTCPSCYQSMP
ncbi:hypothetical protein ABZ820_12315 [Streptomyces diacarni]|uniref:hypothetical protein n=1 Tax=Streptomyces diacarni TaxID=2800381 RepID=UPI0033F4DFEC